MALQHLRSSTANKRPLPAGMSDGQLAINTNAASPGVFFKTSTGVLVKAGPVHVGTTAPNSSPASGGETGNTTGELWLDTSLTPNELKTWDGSAWVSATGQEIPVSKLIDGSARQLLQTDAAGTGVEWTSDVDVPGTLDVTSTATFDGRIYTILGSASTPAISPATDTNTGIAFSGTEAVNIVSNATTILSVQKDNATADVQVTGKISSTNTNTASAFIPTGTTAPTNGLYLPTTNSVAISTNGTGRLFVTDAGRVGIGISSPGANLEVLSSTSPTDIFISEGTSPSVARLRNVGGIFRLDADVFNTATSSSLLFGVDGAERARITSDGRLGLGSSVPLKKLHVTDTSSGSSVTALYLENAGAATSTQVNLDFDVNEGTTDYPCARVGAIRTGNANTPTDLIFAVRDGADNTLKERVRLDSQGRLGIGTTSPAFNLDVSGSGTQIIRCQTTDTSGSAVGALRASYLGGGGGALTTVDLRAGDAYAYLTTITNHPLAFGTNTSERARIDSSGRLLVGTSSALGTQSISLSLTPQQQLAGTSTAGAAYAQSYFAASEGGAAIHSFNKSRGTTTGSHVVVVSGDRLGRVSFTGSDGTNFIEAASVDAQVDGTPGTNDMPGRLVFSTTADGASSPTERMRITSAGVLQIADAGDIAVGTTTGTKIGTATTQKLGFFNKTPVVQPTAVANATDAASVITQLNALLSRMRDLGLIAT